MVFFSCDNLKLLELRQQSAQCRCRCLFFLVIWFKVCCNSFTIFIKTSTKAIRYIMDPTITVYMPYTSNTIMDCIPHYTPMIARRRAGLRWNIWSTLCRLMMHGLWNSLCKPTIMDCIPQYIPMIARRRAGPRWNIWSTLCTSLNSCWTLCILIIHGPWNNFWRLMEVYGWV